MRKYACILLASLIFSKITNAQPGQVYKPFKIDIGIGTTGQPFDVSGLLFYAEPSFTLGGRFKPGLRFEYVFLDMKNIGSSALTFDYYFITTNRFRFFAGGGYSLFTTSSTGGCSTGTVTAQNFSTTKKPGALARLGFDIDHFHLSVEYNFVPSTYFNTAGNTDQTASTVLYRNSYFALKFGVSIGGGKRQ
jgi:hypothetical protein